MGQMFLKYVDSKQLIFLTFENPTLTPLSVEVHVILVNSYSTNYKNNDKL